MITATNNKLFQISGTGPEVDLIVLETVQASEVLDIEVHAFVTDHSDPTVQLVFSQDATASEESGVTINSLGSEGSQTGNPQFSAQLVVNGSDLCLRIEYLYTVPLTLDVDAEWIVRRRGP